MDVARTYELVNGFNMPVEIQSRAGIRFFGASEFRMTIRYELVGGIPVSHGEPSVVHGIQKAGRGT